MSTKLVKGGYSASPTSDGEAIVETQMVQRRLPDLDDFLYGADQPDLGAHLLDLSQLLIKQQQQQQQ